VCEIFNLLHFWSTAQRGGGHGPSGPMVNTPVCADTQNEFEQTNSNTAKDSLQYTVFE